MWLKGLSCKRRLAEPSDRTLEYLFGRHSLRFSTQRRIMAQWCKKEQRGELPLPRSSHTITAVKDKAYCIGGENEPRVPIGSTVHVYDLVTGEWSAVEPCADSPSPRVGHTAVAAAGDNIYMFGGRYGIAMGDGASAELYCFDSSSRRWGLVQARGSPPEARSYHAMAAAGSTLYVFGGCGEGKRGRLNDLYAFDCDSSTWTQLPTCQAIVGRGGAGLVATADAVYVIAGFSGEERNDVWRHDLASGRWAEVVPREAAAALPARSVFGAAALGNLLVVTGGEVDPAPAELGHAGAGHFSSDTYTLDTTRLSDGWTKLAVKGTVPAPRGWFAFSVVTGTGGSEAENSVLIHGGNSPGNERLGDMHIMKLL